MIGLELIGIVVFAAGDGRYMITSTIAAVLVTEALDGLEQDVFEMTVTTVTNGHYSKYI